MQVVLLAVLSLVACASASVEVASVVGYHDRVAIPMAEKIRAAEKTILANQSPQGRIVGGTLADSHPYMGGLLLTYVNRPGIGVCGSVLVTRTRLLTAAHCWFDGIVQANRAVVVLGSNLLFSGGTRIDTTLVSPHHAWDPATQHNNIAIISLRNPVLLSSTIQPIALATNTNETFVGNWAVAVGFGFSSDSQTSVPVNSVLREVLLQVITVDQCRSTFGAMAQPNTICTDGTGGVGTCRGDGGGPLVITRNGRPLLIGVITFGAAVGCELGFPSGFSRITSFLSFINQNR